MKYLLTTDGSKPATWACEALSRLPGVASGTVTLLHVATPLPEAILPFPDVFVEDQLLARSRAEQAYEEAARERISASRRALPADWTVVPRLRLGRPAHEILEEIAETRPDLVVLGATGMDVHDPASIGGVAQKVVRYAPCPVLVVREGNARMRRVLVALDRAPHGRQVLTRVLNSPWLAGSSLTLTHVVDDQYLAESRIAASQFAGSREYLARLQQAILAEAQEYLGGEARYARDQGAEVDTLLLEGRPATALARRAQDAGFDLVVAGSRGGRGHSWFQLGRTSQALLHQPLPALLTVRTTDG